MKLLAPCRDTRKSCIDVAAMWGGTEKMRSLPLGEPTVSRLRERSEWRTIMGPAMSNLVGSIYAAT